MPSPSPENLRYIKAISQTLAANMQPSLGRFAGTIMEQAAQMEGADIRTKVLAILLLGLMLEMQEFDAALLMALNLRDQIEGKKLPVN